MSAVHTRWVLPIAFTLSLLGNACSLPEPTSSGLEPLATAPIADTDAGRESEPTLHDGRIADALTDVDVHDDVDVIDEVEEHAGPLPAELLPPSHASYELKRGESIAHFARWAEVSVEAVAQSSDLGLLDTLEVGTEIRVPADLEMRSRIEQRRNAHHTRRAEGYLASRGGSLGTEFYTVQTGDTAWSIANDEVGVPVWLLETFNPAADLDSLRPGQDLMIPIVADIVVEAD